jgi:glutathione S-transferase
MPARLFVVPASHPSTAVAKALEIKGVPFETVYLVPVFHKLHQKARFGGAGTVPGLILEDGRKLMGSRAIIRELEALRPDPPLHSDDPRVAEAEEWGDEVLQALVRRVIWKVLAEDTDAQLTYADGLKLFPPVPRPMAKLSGGMVAWAERKLNKAGDAAVRADLANLPRHLDRVDRWLAEGVLGGEALTAADLQVASGLRLLLTSGDVAPLIEGRPAADYARRVFPEYPGHAAAGALPAEWLPAPDRS